MKRPKRIILRPFLASLFSGGLSGVSEAPYATVENVPLGPNPLLNPRVLSGRKQLPCVHLQHYRPHFLHTATNTHGGFHPFRASQLMQWNRAKHQNCRLRLLVKEVLPYEVEHRAVIFVRLVSDRRSGCIDDFDNILIALNAGGDFLLTCVSLLSRFCALACPYMVGADDCKNRSSGLEPGRGVSAGGRSKGPGRRREYECHEADGENDSERPDQRGRCAVINPSAGFHWFSDVSARHRNAVGSLA